MNFLVVSQKDWSERAKMVMLQIIQPTSPLKGYRFQKMMPKSVKLDVGKINQIPYFITRDMFSGDNLGYATRSLIWQIKQTQPKSAWRSIDANYTQYSNQLADLQKLCNPPENVTASPQQTKPSEYVGKQQRRIVHILKVVKYMQSGTSEYGFGYGHYTQTQYSRFKAIDQQGNVAYIKLTGKNNQAYHDQTVQGKVFLLAGTVFTHKLSGSGLKYTTIGRITKLQQLPQGQFNSIDPSAGFVRKSMGGLDSFCDALLYQGQHQQRFVKYAGKMKAQGKNFNFQINGSVKVFGKNFLIWGMIQDDKVVLCAQKDIQSQFIPTDSYVIQPFMLYYLK